jgi:hypothetical protein
VTQNYSKFEGVAGAQSDFFEQKECQDEIHRKSVSVYGQKVFYWKEMSVCNRFKDCRKALSDDPEKHRGKATTSHTNENCVIVEGLITDDRIVKVR